MNEPWIERLCKWQTYKAQFIRNIGIHLSYQAVPFSPSLQVQVVVWVEIGQYEPHHQHLVMNPKK